jgi:hypothetical protein
MYVIDGDFWEGDTDVRVLPEVVLDDGNTSVAGRERDALSLSLEVALEQALVGLWLNYVSNRSSDIVLATDGDSRSNIQDWTRSHEPSKRRNGERRMGRERRRELTCSSGGGAFLAAMSAQVILVVCSLGRWIEWGGARLLE